ncbi:MAG: spore coat protein [Oscillospiraceae bacterium]|nr:spore coat protein [Oscillospiraceae bacterium]
MNDQERVTDMILSEKKMSTNYNIFASECVDDQLRNEYLTILNKSHQTQTALFKAAQAKGWYTVEQAPQSKISETYNKFNAQKP